MNLNLKTTIDAILYLEQTLPEVIRMMGYDPKHTPKVTTEDDCVMIDGGVGIMPFNGEMTTHTIVGDRKHKLVQYQICIMVHDPGVYRYADGSGQPPSDDLEEIKGEVHNSPMAAIRRALELYHKNVLNNVLETVGMAQQEAEEAELEH